MPWGFFSLPFVFNLGKIKRVHISPLGIATPLT